MIKLKTPEPENPAAPLTNERPFALAPALAPLISINSIPFRVGPLILIDVSLSWGKGLLRFIVWTPDPGIEKLILRGEVLLLTRAFAALIASRKVQSVALQTPSSWSSALVTK